MTTPARLLVLLVAVATGAWAMSIREHSALLAWSADGLSALIQYDADGPEGGGSHGYGLVTCAGEQARVTVSSTFSPGGPSRPQTITEKACREGLTALGKALEASGFKGVTVTPGKCATKTREEAVQGGQPRPAPSGWTIAKQGDGLVISEGTLAVLEVPKASSAIVSPSGRAILVMAGGWEDSRVLGLWTRPATSAPFTRCSE